MSYESVQEMFSRAAARFGPDPAVERAGRALSYAQLEADSNRLANFLLARGAGRGSMVGILALDPARLITGILAALKAGAVFVPLDPTFPDQRLAVMAGQVGPRFYVTESAQLDRVGAIAAEAGGRVSAVCLDAGAAGSDDPNVEVLTEYADYREEGWPGVEADPEAPCSVYFTSGSTGKPKAILGRLKGIDHFVRWEIDALGVEPGTRVTQLGSPCFDGFLKDAFVPLCSGGTVCAPESRDLVLEPHKLIDWLDIEGIDILHCFPSLFRAIVNEGLDPKYFAAMRYVVMAGEPLLPSDVRRWMEAFSDRIKLVNLYGTTETSLAKFCHFVTAEDIVRPSIPVGKPIRGAAVLVIDSASQPCHHGAVGEIYIRTPYRSHGYYGEPQLTSEVFVRNPFNDDPDDIVHKTGDYGRLLEDGSLEYLGRRDQQVKVRGVRVELGEIENLLRSHHAVDDVAVVDRDDGHGNKLLAAYVTMSNGTRADELRGYLVERLPEAMVPSAFVEMEQLPRTLNGKIDRKALPALEVAHAAESEEKEPPRTPVEEIVAGIWREVLKLPSVGRDDNFFNLGGHSLLVTQVLLRIRDMLKVELPVRGFFESPTLKQMARLVEEQFGAGRLVEQSAIEPTPRDEELPLSFAQQRMWFLEQFAAGTTTFHIPLGVRLSGPLNVAALEQSFGEVIRRHEALRTSFPVIDGEPLQIIHPAPRYSIPVIDLGSLEPEAQEVATTRLTEAIFERPFDLETGPLARLVLFRYAEQDHALACTLHHIVSDGWSKGVLVKEISALYESFRGGAPSPLAELAVQYADFAAWQRQRLSGEALERELEYWRKNLAGAPPVLNVPTDRPRPPVQTYRGAAEPFLIERDLSDALKELSRRQGVTLFMTLLAGFQTLLQRYAAEDDFVVGTSVANRVSAQVEGLIGCFVNMLALRADCSGDPTFEEMVGRVRELTLQAYTRQSLPFEKLVEELQPQRNLSYPPLFQVVFSLQNAPMTDLALAGLRLSFPRQVEVTTSKYDLLLDMWEGTDGLAGALEYNPDLFDRDTAARMVGHLRNLLAAAAARPAARLSELPLADEDERRRSEEGSCGPRSPYPADKCLQELFEEQAQAEPGATAVVCRGELLTYSELSRRSARLARLLRSEGVRRGDLVGVCMKHSLEEVVALLGVLKAGAGYVPLDPSHPPQRHAYVVKDAGLSLVLTDEDAAAEVEGCGARALSLDALGLDGDDDGAAFGGGATPQDVAYVIYTSGSTGKPKGVRVPHRTVGNLLASITCEPGVTARHSVLSVTTL
ncbi:MAG: amino acid adenylation domain-containing protein, partial [Pyrinomonadaceae bacterium]